MIQWMLTAGLVLLIETNMKTVEINSGSWRCKHCGLSSGLSWGGIAREEDAPGCCYGEKMLPYRYKLSEEDNLLVNLKKTDNENRPSN